MLIVRAVVSSAAAGRCSASAFGVVVAAVLVVAATWVVVATVCFLSACFLFSATCLFASVVVATGVMPALLCVAFSDMVDGDVAVLVCPALSETTEATSTEWLLVLEVLVELVSLLFFVVWLLLLVTVLDTATEDSFV